jgi:hypothetical protein
MAIKTKACSRCKVPKPLDEFGVNNATRDGLAYYCKPCARAINRARPKEEQVESARRYRERNRQKINAAMRLRNMTHHASIRAAKAKIIERNREYVDALKKRTGCMECGFTGDPQLLEYDHVSGEKKASVSRLVLGGYSIAIIDAEIAKCELVCQMHHRMRTIARLV